MSTYFPPKKGTDASPQTGQPAVSNRRDGAVVTGPAVDEVLDRTQPIVDAWVAAQRANVANSTNQIHRATLDHPDVEASYQNHYGAETITSTAKPREGSDAPGGSPAVDAPNALADLAQQEVVKPGTPLYLMVLYKDDQIAAVPMDGLKNPAPDYTATCAKTHWTPYPGARLLTLQARLDGVEYLLLPLDLTGQVGATHLYLSTNALGDAIETRADADALPVMNGSDGRVYTVGGAYSYSGSEGFKLQAEPARSSTGVLGPVSIDASGMCYYAPTLQGSCQISIDSTSHVATVDDTPLAQLLTDAINKVDIDKVDAFSVLVVQDYKVTDIIYGRFGNAFNPEEATYQTDSYIFTVGPDKVGGSVVGYGFYAAGSFGSAPTLQDFKAAVSGAATTSVDANGASIVGTDVGPTDTSTAFPLMSYKGGKLTVAKLTVLGSQYQKATETFDTTKQKLAPTAGRPYTIQYGKTEGDPGSDSFQNGSYSHSITYAGPPPPGAASDELAAQYLQQSLDAASRQPNVKGPVKRPSGTITVRSEFNQPPDLSAPLNAVPPGEPLNNYNTITIAYSSSGGPLEEITGAASLELPTFYPADGSLDLSASAEIFDQRLVFSGKGAPPSITVHAFPPLWEGSGFYTRLDGDAARVVTPYDSYKAAVPTGSFVPWLHVSNGSHAIQGYAVDSMPHAFLDGDKTDWLPALAKALKCEVYEIATMVMDVTLAKIKAVAHIKPPVYGGGG